jgi:hypothetical protein
LSSILTVAAFATVPVTSLTGVLITGALLPFRVVAVILLAVAILTRLSLANRFGRYLAGSLARGLARRARWVLTGLRESRENGRKGAGHRASHGARHGRRASLATHSVVTHGEILMLGLETNKALLKVVMLKLDARIFLLEGFLFLLQRLLLLFEFIALIVKAALVALELLEVGVEATVVFSENLSFRADALNLSLELTA